jgi:WD40 repeat protein
MKLYPSADAFNIIQNYPFKDAVLSSVQDGFVTAARFSPDGKYIVIVGCNIPNYCETNLPNKEIDGFLRMIQTKSGKQTLHMTYSGAITSIAISPDSKHILLGGDDGNARVLDAASGKEISRKTHVATVTTVAFSPDGKYAASSGYDGNIHIWNSTSGAEIFHIIYDEPSLHNIVNTIAFSPDGKYIASGGDNGLRVWDIRTVEEIAYMEHDYGIISLAYSPDGKHIITGSVDNNARIWEVATASLVDQLIHSGDSSSGFSEIKSVAFSPDGKFVATASSDNTARVWIPNGGGYEVSRMTHGSTVNSVDFSPNGRFVVSSSWDGTVRVWETVTGRDVARMAYRGLASTAIFSPDGKYVISSGCDQLQEFTCAAGDDVRVWETDPGDELPSIYQEDGVYGLFLDTDSNHLVAENGNSARIWDLQTQKETFRISYESYLHALAYNSTKNYVATAGDDKNIEIWDASKGDSVTKLQSEFAFPMVFSPDGKYLATGSYGEPVAIHILDSTSWKEASQISPAQFGGIAPFLFSQDGKYLIAGGCDTSVDRNCNQRTAVGVWELSTGRQIARIQHERPVRSIAISPDGEYIISGGCDEVDFNQNSICIHGSAFIWKTATGEKDFQINYAGDVTAGSFSPDGKYVASGGCEQYESFYCIAGSIHIWDISARKEIAEISQDAAITSVAFSPDSKYIALGGEARTIQIFDLTTGNEIARATHKDVVTAIIFSLNGTYVITSSGDGTIRAWIWKPNDIIDYACSRVPRNLTSAEWSEHISDTMPYAKICPNVP